jgi:hypothetical protein
MSRFSGEREMGKGAPLPPSPPLHTTPSPHRDAVPMQMGATVDERRLKHP